MLIPIIWDSFRYSIPYFREKHPRKPDTFPDSSDSCLCMASNLSTSCELNVGGRMADRQSVLESLSLRCSGSGRITVESVSVSSSVRVMRFNFSHYASILGTGLVFRLKKQTQTYVSGVLAFQPTEQLQKVGDRPLYACGESVTLNL